MNKIPAFRSSVIIDDRNYGVLDHVRHLPKQSYRAALSGVKDPSQCEGSIRKEVGV